jgi:hypothetical protein
MPLVSRDRQVQISLPHRGFDNLGMRTALMLNPPRCNARQGHRQPVSSILAPLLVKGNFFNSWRPKVLTLSNGLMHLRLIAIDMDPG